MKEEIGAGVVFLINLVRRRSGLRQEKIEEFGDKLASLLRHSYEGHWYPANPSKGQAYRCIRINGNQRRDPVLLLACQECDVDYNQLKLPQEMTLWIDPWEVWCRSGEGSQPFTVARFDQDGEPVPTPGQECGLSSGGSPRSLPESSSDGTSDEEEPPLCGTTPRKTPQRSPPTVRQVPGFLTEPTLPWPHYPTIAPLLPSAPLLGCCLLPAGVHRAPPGLLLPLWGPPLPRARKRRK